MGEVLDIGKIYEKLKEEVKEESRNLPLLTLASVVIDINYSSQRYISCQEKLSKEVGIEYILVRLEGGVSLGNTIREIKELNEKDRITGIVVNKPFPHGWNEEDVFSAIDLKKDIEGMNPCNLGRLFGGKPCFVPPTILSILEFIKLSGVSLYGKEVTIVGFSTLIGKPLAIILGKEFASVSITHIATYQAGRLPFYVNNADILISAAGVPELIKGEWIKKGAIVIDVGVGEKKGKVCGDIEFEKAKKRAAFITPVVGGVGRLTTMFLLKNLIKAAKL
jgi:methylenetetrahydrofolate dehydrogenase (NADP+)/methenyltetrahydrofolate cyclohydrolase